VPVVTEPWLIFHDFPNVERELMKKITMVAIMHLFLADADARMRIPDLKLRNLFGKI